MFSEELLGFLFYLFCLNEVSSSCCCKYLRTIRLMDCMGCDLKKVPVFNEQDSIVTLNLRRNNFTWIDLKTFSEYKNLKVIDLRQNPLVCGKIELSQFEVKSDCHSTATVKSKNTQILRSLYPNPPKYLNHHLLIAAYIPQQFPLNVSTTLRVHLYTTRNL